MALHILRKNVLSFKRSPTLSHFYATSSNPKNKKTLTVQRFDSVCSSIASKGFLRPHKSYVPPTNIAEKVKALCASLEISSAGQERFSNLDQKFKLLGACFQDFKHSVPNSQVHELQTVADVIRFYETAVDTTVPFEAFKKTDLPENLHIQYDYLRFHPDTDTKFNGKTAFPKSSTLVTGLKYRGKYNGHKAKQSWP